MDEEMWGQRTSIEAPQGRRPELDAQRTEVKAGDLVSGKYRLLRVLGVGSMGSVWAARNELTNRDFAVKFLLPELAKNHDALERFFLEARACGQIRHPAIVDVYDMGQAEDGSPYIVMELLEGEGFDQRIHRQGRMRAIDVCRYVAIVARGLEEAHTRGLVHRDLKPGNIFFSIDKNGEVFPKVLDFGISKETSAEHFDYVKTSTGTVLGSPAYMSPEQARGESDVDARSDLWSLGVIMYEAVTGRLPFDASNYNALMLRIITGEHTPIREIVSDCPSELEAIVDSLLDKGRDGRIRSAGELADRLEHAYSGLTLTPFSRPERALSLPPPPGLPGTTQTGWLQPATARNGKLSRGVLAVAAVLVVGMSATTAVVLSRAGTSAVAPASRFGGNVAAVGARALAEQERAAAEARAEAAAASAAAQASAPPVVAQRSATASTALPAVAAPHPRPTATSDDVDNAGF